MWVIVSFSLTHSFTGPCAKWRVSPAQRVLNYSSGVELCVINQSKEPWGSCEAQSVRCTGHGAGCLLITLGLVSTVPSTELSSLGAGSILPVGFLARDHSREPRTREVELWTNLCMHIVWEYKPASEGLSSELSERDTALFGSGSISNCLSHMAIDTHTASLLMDLT